MSEESKDPKDIDDLSESGDFSLKENETDWGEAWESAFEAEDDMFTSDEEAQPEDFFLTEDEGAGTTSSSEAPSSAPKPHSAHAAATNENIETGSPSSGLVISLRIPPFFSKTAELLTNLKEHYSALQVKQKIIFGGGVAILCLAGSIFFILSPEKQIPPSQQTAGFAGAESESSVENFDILFEDPVAGVNDLSEKIRKKWTFSPFFIPASSPEPEADKTISFVVIDLSLTLLLDEGEEIPEDKKAFVRDIIYQFFINRPLYELRRFSLARGDMNRALRAWLQKQWPEGAIQAIIFNRYLLT